MAVHLLIDQGWHSACSQALQLPESTIFVRFVAPLIFKQGNFCAFSAL